MRLRLLALFLAAPLSATAQTPDELLTQARQAFENLDFDAAARSYARVLAVASGATSTQRDTAQLYLGVSFEYAGQRANAVSAFSTFVRAHPCAPAPSLFGASVEAAYLEARSGLFAVGFCAVRHQELRPDSGATLRIGSTRDALVRLSIVAEDGRTIFDFGEQPVSAVQSVRWTRSPDPGGFTADPSRYFLSLEGREPLAGGSDTRRIAVMIYAPAPDTVPHPAPVANSLLRPESRPLTPALSDLGKGVVLGAGVAVAATTLSHGSLDGATTPAALIGGAISLAGVVAFFKGASHRTIPENVRHNASLRQAWTAARDSVVALNQLRTTERALIIEPEQRP